MLNRKMGRFDDQVLSEKVHRFLGQHLFFCPKTSSTNNRKPSYYPKSRKLPSYLRTISPSFSRLPTPCRCKSRNVNQKQGTIFRKQRRFSQKQGTFSQKQRTFSQKQRTFSCTKGIIDLSSRHAPLAMQLALFKLLKYL